MVTSLQPSRGSSDAPASAVRDRRGSQAMKRVGLLRRRDSAGRELAFAEVMQEQIREGDIGGSVRGRHSHSNTSDSQMSIVPAERP